MLVNYKEVEIEVTEGGLRKRKGIIDNLIIASTINSSDKFLSAIKQWEFRHFGVPNDDCHCQLCNAALKHIFVAIINKVNGIMLVVGKNCYEDVAAMATKGKLDVALQKSGAYRKELTNLWKKITKEDGRFVGWLENQELSENLKTTLEFAKKLGFFPSQKDAEELIGFYKQNRKFALEELIERKDLVNFQHLRLLPKEAFLSSLPRIEKILEKGIDIRKTKQSKDYMFFQDARKFAKENNFFSKEEDYSKRREEIIKFYRNNKVLNIEELRWNYNYYDFPHKLLLPKQIKLSSMERFDLILKRGVDITRKREEAAANKSREIEREKIYTERKRLNQNISWFKQWGLILSESSNNPSARELEWTNKNLEKIKGFLETGNKRPEIKEFVVYKIIRDCYKDDYKIICNDDGRWEIKTILLASYIEDVGIKYNSQLSNPPFQIKAVPIDRLWGAKKEYVFLPTTISLNFPLVNFNIPDKNNSGCFIGKLNGKFCLPFPKVEEAGSKKVFVEEERPNCFKVAVLDLLK